MKGPDRANRDALILRLHEQRVPKVEIAARTGLRPQRIRTILAAHGVSARPIHQETRAPQNIWEVESADRRRREIWRRQREAARQALASMQEQSDA